MLTLGLFSIFQLKWARRSKLKDENIPCFFMSAIRISDVSGCWFPWRGAGGVRNMRSLKIRAADKNSKEISRVGCFLILFFFFLFYIQTSRIEVLLDIKTVKIF